MKEGGHNQFGIWLWPPYRFSCRNSFGGLPYGIGEKKIISLQIRF